MKSFTRDCPVLVRTVAVEMSSEPAWKGEQARSWQSRLDEATKTVEGVRACTSLSGTCLLGQNTAMCLKTV